jgi:hypothetical protein
MMAVLLCVKKISEDQDQMTYEYGPDPDHPQGYITLLKSTGRPVNEDDITGAGILAYRAIYAGKKRTGDWPNEYTHAS